MKWLGIALCLVLFLAAAPAFAEKPVVGEIGFSGGISPGELAPTPEMWFYEQYAHQYQDPKAAVRQKAEFRAAQRQARIAARRWFGFSNARPTAASDPIHGTYSPGWTSNGHYPFRWSGFGPAVVVLRTERSRSTY
jgi:hypothetical protein